MAKVEEYGKVQRLSYARIDEPIGLPNLIQVQLSSYRWFTDTGLREALQEVFPISDFTGNLELNFIDYSLGEPKYEVHECKERDVSYQAPLKLRVRLIDKENGEIKESEVYMGDLPLMTEKGTFIINGAERVVVSQLVKSPGVYFSDRVDVAGNRLFGATIIPIAVPGSSWKWTAPALSTPGSTKPGKSLLQYYSDALVMKPTMPS